MMNAISVRACLFEMRFFVVDCVQGKLSRSAPQPMGRVDERASLIHTVPGPLSSTISMQEHGADPELVRVDDVCRVVTIN